LSAAQKNSLSRYSGVFLSQCDTQRLPQTKPVPVAMIRQAKRSAGFFFSVKLPLPSDKGVYFS